MDESKGEAVAQRTPAFDLWRRTLSQVPTTFGRLVYLSTLRDSNTGMYQHYGLAQRFGEEHATHTLCQSHSDTFAEWLGFNLEQQKTDLEEYISTLPEDLPTVLAAWARLLPYKNLVPATARDAERMLFFTDLETVLELLRNEHAVVCPDPDA